MTRVLGGIETQMAAMHQELAGTTQGAQCVRLGGSIRVGELREAARIVFGTYPILRCAIGPQDAGLRFVAHDEFDRVQLRPLPELAATTLESALEAEVGDPVDPSDVVWRLALSGEDGSDDRIIVLTCHHAVIDGFGFQVLFQELFRVLDALRRGADPTRDPAGFPPPIDDFLLPGATGPAQSHAIDAIAYHSEAPVADRTTRMIPAEFSVDGSRRLEQACRARRISVNALLAAALAAACRDLGVIGDETPFKTAVSLRDRAAETGIATDQLGCYIAVADAVLRPKSPAAGDYDLVPLAKQYEAQLFSAMMRTCVRRPSGTMTDLLRATQSLREGRSFAHGIGIANAGTVTLDGELETLQVLDWRGINNRVGGNVSVVLHPIVFAGEQKLGFVYPEPLVDGDVVRALSGRFVELLETVVDPEHDVVSVTR